MKWELEAGKRYWLSKEEELEIQEHNRAFYRHSPEEEAFYKVFALPKEGEPSFELTATDIFNRLQKRFPVLFRGVNPKHFGKVMTKVGAKKEHTIYGSVYKLIFAKNGQARMTA